MGRILLYDGPKVRIWERDGEIDSNIGRGHYWEVLATSERVAVSVLGSDILCCTTPFVYEFFKGGGWRGVIFFNIFFRFIL
jgi:hypothetical protein